MYFSLAYVSRSIYLLIEVWSNFGHYGFLSYLYIHWICYIEHVYFEVNPIRNLGPQFP